jgi:hypothetical protein
MYPLPSSEYNALNSAGNKETEIFVTEGVEHDFPCEPRDRPRSKGEWRFGGSY